MEAEFLQGTPLMVDHTPASAVAAGDVLVLVDSIRIAHSAIAANVKGALAAGGGVYKCPKVSGTAVTQGQQLYWDDTNNEATPTASTHKQLGLAIEAQAAGDTTLLVQHVPN